MIYKIDLQTFFSTFLFWISPWRNKHIHTCELQRMLQSILWVWIVHKLGEQIRFFALRKSITCNKFFVIFFIFLNSWFRKILRMHLNGGSDEFSILELSDHLMMRYLMMYPRYLTNWSIFSSRICFRSSQNSVIYLNIWYNFDSERYLIQFMRIFLTIAIFFGKLSIIFRLRTHSALIQCHH
jgi:hypothetical protein